MTAVHVLLPCRASHVAPPASPRLVYYTSNSAHPLHLSPSVQVYPTLLLVLVVCFVYAVISPFIMPAGAIFFGVAYVVYKHQARNTRPLKFAMACLYSVAGHAVASLSHRKIVTFCTNGNYISGQTGMSLFDPRGHGNICTWY